MNLESDKRLNIQLRLDFSSAPTGEARQAGGEDIESLSVVSEPERPANTFNRVSATSRTAVYGPVRTVVWEGRSREAPPYPDPARPVELRDDAAGDGIDHAHKDDRDRPGLPLDGSGRRARVCQNDVGLQADQFLRERWYPIGVTAVPPKVDPHVAAIGPAQAQALE